MNSEILCDDFWYSSNDGLLIHARKYGWVNDDPHPVVCVPSLTGNAGEFDQLAVNTDLTFANVDLQFVKG